MVQDDQNTFAHTNVRVFYKIAQEAYKEMTDQLNSHRRPKPNGEPGYILTMDPDQKSFKNAFITIVFCGVFLESLLHLLIVEKEDIKVFEKYDRKPYEDKLSILGCTDQSIVELCGKYRASRKEVVHEKAYSQDEFRIAEKEAEIAIELIGKVVAHFKLNMD